jgi:cysteine desulfurase
MIYLDYQATTPTDPIVVEAMAPFWSEKFGNPHSTTHRFGWEADAAVDIARGQIAEAAGAQPNDVIFVSGATEANNLALKGVMARSRRNRLLTVATEHACVMETAAHLQDQGYAVEFLPVDRDGLLAPECLIQAMDEDVALVSVMTVNNEIGVVQPISELALIAHKYGALFHTDAAQAFGKLPLAAEADLISLSAHKTYGPKGIGALIVRNAIKLFPQIHGGGQERGRRSGTLAPALCVGFGVATRQAFKMRDAHAERMKQLWQRFVAHLDAAHLDYRVNGSTHARWFGNLNISFPGHTSNRLISDAKGLALSSGAACASASGKGSYVLPALGLNAEAVNGALRIGFGVPTTEADIDMAADILVKVIKRL